MSDRDLLSGIGLGINKAHGLSGVLGPGTHDGGIGHDIHSKLHGRLGLIGLILIEYITLPSHGHPPAGNQRHHPAVDLDGVEPGFVADEPGPANRRRGILDPIHIVIRMKNGMIRGQTLQGLFGKNLLQLLHNRPVKRCRSKSRVIDNHASIQEVFPQPGPLTRGILEEVMPAPIQHGIFFGIRADFVQGLDFHLVMGVDLFCHVFKQIIDVIGRGIPVDIPPVYFCTLLRTD